MMGEERAEFLKGTLDMLRGSADLFLKVCGFCASVYVNPRTCTTGPRYLASQVGPRVALRHE
ncbi:MAG: hypothetical protein ACRD3O_23245 [Terriglobia bacterium]